MEETKNVSLYPRHSLIKTIWLHLFPGILIVILFYFVSPVIINMGFPSTMSLLLCMLLVIILFELGHLYYIGKKINKRFSLKGVIFFKNKIKPLHFSLIVVFLFAFTVAAITFIQRIEILNFREYFSFLPVWFFYGEDFSGFSKSIIIFSAIFRLISDGMIIPVIEELYFRAYLLPRLSHFKYAAPVINALLFAIYHLWQPWNIVILVIVSLIYCYAAWLTKNFYISLALHGLINFISALIFLISLL
ncbi:MAG: CPBP family intramembrane metalloprotease [Candidatus Aminicenantes bacterium]|nr:CPBP family intramembrane metalloprotease [Candidatus Aminicenantes bacterium]